MWSQEERQHLKLTCERSSKSGTRDKEDNGQQAEMVRTCQEKSIGYAQIRMYRCATTNNETGMKTDNQLESLL